MFGKRNTTAGDYHKVVVQYEQDGQALEASYVLSAKDKGTAERQAGVEFAAGHSTGAKVKKVKGV